MTELDELKEEIGQLATRMGNVEGYFNNFDVTLNNHMTDYKHKQESIDKAVSAVEGKLNWGFWVIFSLLMTVIAGFIAATVMLLGALLEG